MDNCFIWLVVGELIILLFIFIVKLIFKYAEKKKIDGILEYIDKRAKEKEINKKFQECIDIINKNNVSN